MSNRNDDNDRRDAFGDGDRHITTDRSTIREWADEHRAEPVRRSGGDRDTNEVGLMRESERGDDHERMDWDEFFDEMDRNDHVVAVHDRGDDRQFHVIDRNDAVQESSMADDELLSQLEQGETVSTEVTETTVVEETIVEHADIESELIDRSTVEESIVDAELVSRDLGECTVEGLDDHRSMHDEMMFDVGHSTTEDFEVSVRADEVWTVTKERVEQAAIESRVVDRDVERNEETMSDTIESRIDVGDVEETILESGILEGSGHDRSSMDSDSFRSEFTDDDAIISEFVERKTVEEEYMVERAFTGTIDAAETMNVDVGHGETIETEMASADEYEVGEMDVDAYDRSGTTAGGMAGDSDMAGTGDSDMPATGDSNMAETGDSDMPATGDSNMAETGDSDMPTTGDTGDVDDTPGGSTASGGTFTIDEDDQGKTVVDASGDEVGIVSDVQAGTMYVDPHPSMTDKIRAKLDWGNANDESYPLKEDRISEITRTQVKIRADEEFPSDE